MPAIEIGFEWYRDESGYDLLPEQFVPDSDPERNPSLSTLLGENGIWFPERIARRGGTLQPYQPLIEFDALYAQFLKIETSVHLLDFVERFGPLTERGIKDDGYDDVQIVIQHVTTMRA